MVWISCVFAGWSKGDPSVPKNVLYKPTFLLLDDSWTAGTAFIVRIQGQPGLFLFTANHLFGPDAGLKDQMSPDDIASQVKGVTALSMQDVGKDLWFPTFVKIPDAGSVESHAYSKDLAVFKASDTSELQALELAAEMPKKGDRVWIFARQRGDDTPGLFVATVDESGADKLTYIFDKGDFRLPGTSGAPVLNEKGEVVGINLAGGPIADKGFKGWANPISAIQSELASVLSH